MYVLVEISLFNVCGGIALFFTTANFSGSRGSQTCRPYYLVRLRWAGLPPGSVASRRRAVGCGGQRRRERSSSCSGTKGRRGPRSGELPRLLERGGGWAGGVARRGALFRGQGGSTATFRTGKRNQENKREKKGKRVTKIKVRQKATVAFHYCPWITTFP